MGCVGALGYATMQIAYSLTVASMISVLFFKGRDETRSRVGLYSFLFVTLALLVFTVNLVQLYDLAVACELLAKKIRQRML